MKYKELFSSYRVIKDKLLDYGFTCFSNVYTYAKDFMNDEFQALIIIDERGEIDGKVVEKAFDENITRLKMNLSVVVLSERLEKLIKKYF